MGDVIRFPVRPRPRPVDPFQRARDDLLRVLFGPQQVMAVDDIVREMWKNIDRLPCDVEPGEVS